MESTAGSIEGLISDDFGPVKNATVDAVHLTQSSVAHSTSDASGYYRLDDLPRGTYSLWITAPLHNSVSIPKVFVEAGQVVVKDVYLSLSGKQSSEESLSFR